MKKNLIATILGASILFQCATIVQADSSLDRQYSNAYDATMKVVNLGQREGVKPFWKEGSSDFGNVVVCVRYGMQKDILTARAKIDELPKSIQTMKNTLSSILDDYQHPIYEKTIEGLSLVDKYKEKFNKFTGKENTNELYIDFQYAQNYVRSMKALIKDIPLEFKASYSSAIDERQQFILNAAVDLVNLTKETKDASFKMHTYLILNHIRNSVSICCQDPADRDEVILNFANYYIAENDKTVINKALSNDELINLALKNGFKETTDSSKQFYNNDINRVFEGPNKAVLLIHNDDSFFYLICKSSDVDNLKEILTTLMPNHIESILSKAKTPNVDYMVGSNSLDLVVSSDNIGETTTFWFSKLYNK